MILKNCQYMESTDFISRQGSFAFFFRESVEFLKQFRADCRKGWRELFHLRRKIKAPAQLTLNFIRNISEWADWRPEKNLQMFI